MPPALKAGEALLATTGTLGDEPLSAGTRLDFRLQGFDIAEVARVAGVSRELPSREITARGGLAVRPADFVLTDVEGTIGQGDFTVDRLRWHRSGCT